MQIQLSHLTQNQVLELLYAEMDCLARFFLLKDLKFLGLGVFIVYAPATSTFDLRCFSQLS